MPSLKEELFRRKPVVPPPATVGGLQRRMGTFQLAMLGVGATVGTGIFFVMHQAVPVAGPAIVISFVIAAVAAGLSALCYAEMASAVPLSGSSYSYAYATLGELVAVVIAACLALEYGVSTAAVSAGWSGYLNRLLTDVTGVSLPPELLTGPLEGGVVNLPAIVLVWLCALLLVAGTRESAMANAVISVVKLAVLVLFAAVAFTAFRVDNFADFAPTGFVGVTSAAATVFFVFVGLDAVSTAGDEVRDPQRSLPRAIIIALVAVVSVYLLVAVAALGVQPWQQFADPAQQEASLAVLLENVVGSSWPATVLAAGAVISIFTVALVTLYGQSRILFTIGRDGLLPRAFARVSPRTRTPVVATLVVATIVSVLTGFIPLSNLWDLVSAGTLLAFIVVSIGVIVLRRTRPDLPRGFRVPGYPVTPILSVIVCVWLMLGLGLETWLWFALWILVVVAGYFAWGRRHATLGDPSAEAREESGE